MVEERPCSGPCCVLKPLHCGGCGKQIGEIDYTAPHTDRKWCRACKSFTFIVVKEAERSV
jgi:hypothetical protein